MTRPTTVPLGRSAPATAAEATAMLEGALRALDDAPARLAAISDRVRAGLADLEQQVDRDLLTDEDARFTAVVDRFDDLTATASSGGVTVRLRTDGGEVTGTDRPLRGGAEKRLLAHAETALRVARRDLTGRIAATARAAVVPAAADPDRAAAVADLGPDVPAELPVHVGDALARQWLTRVRGGSVQGEDPRRTVRVTLRADGGVELSGTPRARQVGHSRPLLAAVAAAYTDASQRWREHLGELALVPPEALPPELETALERVVAAAEEVPR